jgi:hypothetical protein
MLNLAVHKVNNWSVKGEAAVKNATTDAMCWFNCVLKLPVACTVH